MSKPDLQFEKYTKLIEEKLGKSEWTTVFALDKAFNDVDRGCFFAALIEEELIPEALEKYSWDIHGIDGGRPGFSSYYENKTEIIEYYRFPENGIERLVYWRTFSGLEDTYFEISEEFRLFFDLYEKNKEFFHFDNNGDKDKVATITESEIKIKTKYLKKFISAKKMKLIIFFEFMNFSNKTLKELGLEDSEKLEKGTDFIYSLLNRNLKPFGDDKRQAHGWLLGKKIISGIPNYKPSLWGDEERKYESFIIGLDDDGNEIFYTSDEDYLSNYFGKNPGAPHYLTPIYFKKEVLAKYYANSTDFEVSDGIIRRNGFWSLRIDNNHPDHVNVFLGDLGKLSQKEQLYWKSFNIYSEAGISSTNWERSFAGKPSDPDQADLYFKYSYNRFNRRWEKEFSWHLFKPLSKADEHHLKSLRIPLTQDQKEFDEQILSLTKILIDSLNEKELVKGITVELKDKARGIDKLEAYLKSGGVQLPEMISFLRDLQDLRSSGTAHRKSSNYDKAKAKFNLEDDNYQKVFEDILIKSIMIFNTLKSLYLK